MTYDINNMINSRIFQLTVPSNDDGHNFIRTDRLDLIKEILKNSEYKCQADMPLATAENTNTYRNYE